MSRGRGRRVSQEWSADLTPSLRAGSKDLLHYFLGDYFKKRLTNTIRGAVNSLADARPSHGLHLQVMSAHDTYNK